MTRTDRKRLQQLTQSEKIFLSSIKIKTVQPKQVPAEVQTIDVSLSFIEPHYSKKGVNDYHARYQRIPANSVIP